MSDVDEFEHQLEQEALEQHKKEENAKRTKVDPDGTEYEWDPEKKAWFPKIDVNFIAAYQMSYGCHEVNDDEASKAVKKASDIASASGNINDANSAEQNTDWRHYYYLMQQYAPQEGKEQTTEEKQYYDYYNYYYHYYYEQETKKDGKKDDGEKKGDGENDGKINENMEVEQTEEEKKAAYEKYCKDYEEYCKTYYAEHGAGIGETVMVGKVPKAAKNNEPAENYESTEYWEQYHSDTFVPKYTAEDVEKQQHGANNGKGEEKKSKKKEKGQKRKTEEQQQQGWFQMDEEKNTSVYVTGLPDDITDDEFKDLMNKCGLIVYDPKTKGLKLKLYKHSDGTPKGDGLCCYIKTESVDLALQLLDDYDIRGHKIHIEKAQFQMKGEYDPSKRKYKKLSNKEKRKAKEKQAKLLDWRPDKIEGTRNKNERTVIIKNLFDPKTFETEPEKINTVRQLLRQQCNNYGEVTKINIYDNHPEGVASVTFKQFEEADQCISGVSGGLLNSRVVSAAAWDGRTKYEVKETDEQRAERLKKWEEYLKSGGEKPAGEKPEGVGEAGFKDKDKMAAGTDGGGGSERSREQHSVPDSCTNTSGEAGDCGSSSAAAVTSTVAAAASSNGADSDKVAASTSSEAASTQQSAEATSEAEMPSSEATAAVDAKHDRDEEAMEVSSTTL